MKYNSKPRTKKARGTLGINVLRIRNRRGMTQRELALEAGVHPITIANIERGRTPAIKSDTLLNLARALKCRTDTLLV